MKVLLLLLFCCFEYSAGTYDGYKVYDILPRTPEKHYKLEMIMIRNSTLDFWVKRKVPNKMWTVMVPPDDQKRFLRFLQVNRIDYSEKISNMADVIPVYFFRHLNSLSYSDYPNYLTIYSYIKNLEGTYPNLVTIMTFGKTHEGRTIFGVKICSRKDTENTPGVLITAGLSAREWLGPITALYIIDQLVKTNKNGNLTTPLHQNIAWYILPLMNPDGYEYALNSDRLWRKNMSPNSNCFGVDITKNFDIGWGLSSSFYHNPCHAEYVGPSAFSEPESRALKTFMTQNSHNLKLYLSLRAFGPSLVFPSAYSTLPVPNHGELLSLGKSISQAISNEKTSFPVSPYWNMYNVVGGLDIDWIKSKHKVPLVYSLHLPGGENKFFDPPTGEIQSIAERVYHGMPVFVNYIMNKWPQTQNQELNTAVYLSEIK